MKIDLTELLRQVGNEADIEESDNIDLQEDNVRTVRPVKVALHLVNTGEAVLAAGKAEAEVELECSRCLKKHVLPLSVKLEEDFVRETYMPKGRGEVELKDEDFVSPIDKGNTIDLTEVVRQNILLALPLKSLCDTECKGLSPEQTK